jgi:cobalt-zinc-cadmium efflux system membrane fusion protein
MRTGLAIILAVLGGVPSSAAGPDDPTTGAHATRALIPGIMNPSHDVTLAAPRDGVLAEVLVREGDAVEAGQIVARLDDRAARASVEVARSISERLGEVEYARADLELACSLLDRLERASEANAAGPTELHEAASRVALAQASLDIAVEERLQAQRSLELEQARLAELSIRAPFDGVVVETPGEAGGALTLGSPIVRIVSLETLRGEIYLPSALFGSVAVGDRCTLDASPPAGPIVVAAVVAVDPRIDPASDTFRCWVELANPDRRLPAGFTVTPRLTPDGLEPPNAVASTDPTPSPADER